MTANANPKPFNVSESRSSRQKRQEKRRRLARTAQPSDGAWKWKARRCIWSPEEDCSRRPAQR